MKKVAIAVPIYKDNMSADEAVSFRQLRHFLPGYDTYFVAPEGLKLSYDGIAGKFFEKKYFTGLGSYSQLLMSAEFYRAFEQYDYILIYQLDALVFASNLSEWCEKGYDYIGAPWLAGALPANDPRRDSVGNGGFSLRKVSSFLKTLENYNWFRHVFWGKVDTLLALLRPWKFKNPRQWLLAVKWNYLKIPVFGHVLVEDYFWSFDAKYFNPDFKIAPVNEALKFAFETNPRYCFEKNHHQLPFGCHAWPKYDRQFWEQHLWKN